MPQEGSLVSRVGDPVSGFYGSVAVKCVPKERGWEVTWQK